MNSEDSQQAMEMLNNDKYSRFRSTTEKENFIETTRTTLTNKPDIGALVTNPPFSF